MLGHDLIRPDPERHGGLRITAAAHPVLRGETPVTLRRDLIRIGGEIIKEAPNPETPADEQIEQAEQTLYSLAETGKPSSGFVSFSHALSGAVEMAGEAFALTADASGLQERYPGAQQRNFDRQAGVSEMDALIAYLQVMGTMVDFSTFQPDEHR